LSFLKDLFSRAPQLPEPVYDPFHGHEEARAAAASLKKGDWKEPARLFAAARGDDRASMAGHLAEVGQDRAVEDWHAAQPGGPEPWILRGLMRIGKAWAVRGSGRASEVDDDAWPVFHAGLREAEADFHEAARLAPDDPAPWAYLLITARGLDRGVPEIRQVFEEARRRDPQGWLAPYMALDALSEKWSGTHEQMFTFAREVSAGAPEGSPLHAIVPAAHVERWLHFSMEDPPDRKAQQGWFARREVRDELRMAWAKGPRSPAFRPGRFSTSQLNTFAFTFHLAGDVGPAKEAFEMVSPRATKSPWSHLGDPVDVYKRARNEALTV
jgi:hypothetical protein